VGAAARTTLVMQEQAGADFDSVATGVSMFRVACALMVCVQASFAGDVSGIWQLIVETNQGRATPKMTLQQQGEQITGTYSSRVLGEASITGTVKGDAIEFQFESEFRNQRIKVGYKGRIEGPNTMRGTAAYEGFNVKANWSATKK
jgi:hypothetical protein